MDALRDALADLPGAAFADLLESEGAYLLVVDVPGATAETTTVRAEGRRLEVSAERVADREAGFAPIREGRRRSLDLDLPLSPDVDAGEASASVDRGVLEVRLPRTRSEATVPIE